jgi:hypothetical protein
METITSTVSVAAAETVSVTLEVDNGVDRTFYVEALDDSGKVLYIGSTTASLEGDAVTLTITMSVAPPVNAPTGLIAVAVSDAQVDLAWEPATGRNDVEGYHIYRDGFLVISVTGNKFPDKKLIAQTTYCYVVSSYDLEGNESPMSEEVCATTLNSEDGVLGLWGFATVERTNSGAWEAEGGTASFNTDGSGAIDSTVNVDGTVSSGTDFFAYSVVAEPEGSLTLTEEEPSETEELRVVLSEDWSMMLFDRTSTIIDGIEDTGVQGFAPFIRLDPSRTFSDADLFGEYYFLGYKYDPLSTEEGKNNAYSGIMTAYGNGNIYLHESVNFDGTLSDRSSAGTYSVNPDGTFLMNGLGINYISGNGLLTVTSNADYFGSWGIFFSMKANDRDYTTADLEGTWAVAGFGDIFGAIYHSDFGTITCNDSGSCNFSIKSQHSDGAVEFLADTKNISVSSNGTFGQSLDFGAPVHSGAIGNDGNTIIMNMSFDLFEPNERTIIIGVRCSKCSGP